MGILNAPFDATFIICFVSLTWKHQIGYRINSLKHFLHVLFPDSSSNENRLFLAHPHPVFRFCSLQRSDLCSANRLCQLLSPAGYILKRKHLQKTMHLPHAACWDTEDRFKGLEIHLLWPLSSHTDRTTSRTKHQGEKNPLLLGKVASVLILPLNILCLLPLNHSHHWGLASQAAWKLFQMGTFF